MSKITLAIRFSDDTISTFKVHKTIDFQFFSNILFLLDEKTLKQYLVDNRYPLDRSAKNISEHQNYDNDLAFFAPNTYGITFIDYKNKKVHDYNEYSGFVEVFALNIRLSLEKILLSSFNTYRRAYDDDDNVSSIIEHLNRLDYSFYDEVVYPLLDLKADEPGYYDRKVFESLNPEMPYMFNLYQAFKRHIPVYFIDGNKKSGFERIYFDVKTFSELLKEISQLKDMKVIGISIPEWEFISGKSGKALPLLKEIKDDIELSKEEIAFWKKPTYKNY